MFGRFPPAGRPYKKNKDSFSLDRNAGCPHPRGRPALWRGRSGLPPGHAYALSGPPPERLDGGPDDERNFSPIFSPSTLALPRRFSLSTEAGVWRPEPGAASGFNGCSFLLLYLVFPVSFPEECFPFWIPSAWPQVSCPRFDWFLRRGISLTALLLNLQVLFNQSVLFSRSRVHRAAAVLFP